MFSTQVTRAPCSSALCLYSELPLLPPWPSHSSSPVILRNLRTVSKSPTSQHLSPDFAKCGNNQKAAHLALAGMMYEKEFKINGTEKTACKKKKVQTNKQKYTVGAIHPIGVIAVFTGPRISSLFCHHYIASLNNLSKAKL